MSLIAATSNKHKLLEIQKILRLTVKGCPPLVKENGKTFEENAIKKARAVCGRTGKTAIADDSGLEVKCLGGSPGILSARFAGPSASSEKLCGKLLKAMHACPKRSARFVCVIAIAYPNGKVKTVKGISRGKIIHEMKGNYGFGYDPIFVPCGFKKTFAEMKPSMKNRLSHRGKALRKLRKIISANL